MHGGSEASVHPMAGFCNGEEEFKVLRNTATRRMSKRKSAIEEQNSSRSALL